MALTTNYGLTKPVGTEFYDIDIQNNNMDIVDAELKKTNDEVAKRALDIDLDTTNNNLAQLSNPNLLPNANFRLWSNGTVFTNVVSLPVADWWRVNGSASKVERIDNGMKITKDGTAGAVAFCCKLEDEPLLINKTVTLSWSVDDVIYKKTINNYSTQFAGYSVYENIEFTANQSRVLNWVKLELGTLATPFTPKTKIQEYIEGNNLSNPNLLRNSDFQLWSKGTVFPTTYSGQITADNWNTYNVAGFKVEKTLSGIKCTRETLGFTTLAQYLNLSEYNNYLKGKSVTASFDLLSFTGVSDVHFLAIDLTNSSTILDTITSKTGVNSFTFMIPSNCEKIVIGIYINNPSNTTSSFEIRYCKLELGSMATPFVPKSLIQEYVEGNNLSNPNLLINGDFQVWQRYTTFTSPAGGYFTSDRWICNEAIANGVTYSKVSDGMSLKSNSGNTASGVYQKIENGYKFVGRMVTLSASVNGKIRSMSFVVPSTSTGEVVVDELVKFMITADSNSNIISVYVVLVGENVTHILNWVKLEVGSVATPFVPHTYAEELAMCQRYFQRVNTRSQGSAFSGFMYSYYTGLTDCRVVVPFSTPMRTNPTPTQKGSFVALNVNGVGSNAVITISGFDRLSDNACKLIATSNVTLNSTGFFQMESSTPDGDIWFDAEI